MRTTPLLLGAAISLAAAADWPPVDWSVALDRNILWRTPLPNGGQSGSADWDDRLFLATFDVYREGEPKFSGTILGHCLDARTGKLLWSVKLGGPVKSPMMSAYSDSTSPTPWRRQYGPRGDPYPFNKQHEPMLVGDTITSLEPADDPAKKGWNYLRGIDKRSGKT